MVYASKSSSSSSSLSFLLLCAFTNSFAFMRLLQKAKDSHHQVSFMANQEEEPMSTTSRLISKEVNNINKEAEEDHEMRQEGWLRLSLGGEAAAKPDQEHQTDQTAKRDSFLELNLFSGGSSREQGEEEVDLPLSSSLFHHQHHQAGGIMINPLMFSTRPHEEMVGSWDASTFRTPFVPQSSTYASLMRSPHFGHSSFEPRLIRNNNSDLVAGPSSSFRVIDPPRRPHSGIWFLLQASQNQKIEPFLPQITKSYLRIKDGKMTVRLLMKYLANKLRLEHESQVEIRCRGQELEPMLTLQHVRDSIWRRSSRDNNSSSSQNFTLLPNSSTSEHLMVLYYGRTIS